MNNEKSPFVSRAGVKLQAGIDAFGIDVSGQVCADFGCATGGFTDCLLQNGAKRVYAVDTGYGIVDWNLRNDDRVVVMERTNAMHVKLPEKANLISIDTGWTRQEKVIPQAFRFLVDGGEILSLVKPHYEAEKKYLVKGCLKEEFMAATLARVEQRIEDCGLKVLGKIVSPVRGSKGGNREYVYRIGA